MFSTYFLKERIAELHALDQKYRYDDFYRDSIVVLDTIIKHEILDMFEQYGYPNSNITGVYMRNDTTIGRNEFELLLLPQIPQDRALWVPILEGFLKNGQGEEG